MTEKENICPFCGSDDLDYAALDWINDNSIGQECYCKDCNHWFQQIYNTTFDGQDYDSEEYDEFILDNEQSLNN